MFVPRPQNVDRIQTPRGDAVAFEPDAFHELIAAHGIALEHWQAIRCPVGLTDLGDSLRPHPDHSGCANGYLYEFKGQVLTVLTGMDARGSEKETGWLNSGRSSATFNSYYTNTDEEVFVAAPDRFYPCDDKVVVTTWELAALAPGSTRIRTKYPVEKVVQLVSSLGDRLRPEDLNIVDGQIVAPARSHLPGAPVEVFSVRYLYRPYWLLEAMGHDLRLVQVPDAEGLSGSTRKMPQQASLAREYLFQNQETLGEDPRRVPTPPPDSVTWPITRA